MVHPREISRDKALALVEKIEDMDTRRMAERSLNGDASMNTMVAAFHKVYGLPVIHPDKAKGDFSHISKERLAMRFSLIAEEFVELCAAMDIRADINFFYQNAEGNYTSAGDIVLDGATHDLYTDNEWSDVVAERCKVAIEETDERCLPEIADACFDLKYVIIGFEYEVGIDQQACALEGQASNLSKLMPDGSVLRREDGKVLKGPNFFKPDMAKALKAWGMRDV